MNCFRYFDYTSFAEVDRLTIPQYNLLMEAVRYKQVDMDHRIHQLAWLTFAAKAEKKSGKKTKPVYSQFKKFYDYKAELAKVKKKKDKGRFAGIGKLLSKGE